MLHFFFFISAHIRLERAKRIFSDSSGFRGIAAAARRAVIFPFYFEDHEKQADDLLETCLAAVTARP